MPEPAPGRSTFAPVVLLGLASSGLASVASAKPWVGGGGPGGEVTAGMVQLDAGTRYPVASAISLVLLASWGVLLVTRGWVRRSFAVLAAVAAAGLVAAVVAGYVTLPDTARDSLDQLMGRASPPEGYTGWFWTAAVSALVAVVPAVLAVRLVGRWPEMGSRYDAPVSAPGGAPTRAAYTTGEPQQDLWNALNEGRDPTDTDGQRSGDAASGEPPLE